MHENAVFVLGSTRSGTSAIRDALAATRYSGPGEGHTIGLLSDMSNAVRRHYDQHGAALHEGTGLRRIDRGKLLNEIRLTYLRLLYEHWPTEYYLDKTPNITPIEALEDIKAAMPNAKFIFCSRRGIDNIISKQKKWPDTPFLSQCREWVAIQRAWRQKKTILPLSDHIEVEYYDLATEPGKVAERIRTFLDLDADEETRIAEVLAPPGDKRDLRVGVPLAETGWSDDEIRVFMKECSEQMAGRGYGLESYWG